MSIRFFVVMAMIGLSASVEWGYEGPHGPDHWADDFPDCASNKQSPIAIVHAETVTNSSLGLFKHSMFYSVPTTMNIINNGHSLQVNLDGAYTINDDTVLPTSYRAGQFHLHWASEGTEGGSEHYLNGKQYFAEIHIVHFQSRFAALADAVDIDQGLAVLGIFVDPTAEEDNMEFERLLIPNTTLEGQNMTYVNGFSLEVLLPHNLEYYRYEGSLTTPPCAESVVWSVLKEPIRISPAQKLRLQRGLQGHLSDGSTAYIGNNFRSIQQINNREITRAETCSSASAKAYHVVTLAVAAFFGAILRF